VLAAGGEKALATGRKDLGSKKTARGDGWTSEDRGVRAGSWEVGIVTLRKAKILLVDDSEVVLLTEKMLLRNMGDFEILVAKNGRQAVEKARSERPDLILLDVVMPEMDGFEACRAIRGDQATRGIPILMVNELIGKMKDLLE
jgi:CheY-like chemotaxis protein